MSGPKGYGYEVVSPEEIRRREDEDRLIRCREHAVELAGIQAELRHLGVDAAPRVGEPSSRERDRIISWERELLQAIADTREKIRTASAEKLARRLLPSRFKVEASNLDLGAGNLRRGASAPGERNPEVERIRAQIEGMVKLLSDVREESVREELTAAVEAVVGLTDAAQARGDLLTVKTRIVQALRVQDLRVRAIEKVRDLAGIQGPEADDLRERARTVSAPAQLSELGARVAELVEARRRRADAAYVESALGEVLTELGFAVADGFELQDYGAVAVAEHEKHPGYGLRFQINPVQNTLFTRVVASTSPDPTADRHAEEVTCEEVHAVADRLRRHGVAMKLKFARSPGDVELDRQGNWSAPAARRRRPESHRTRTREATS